MDTLQSILTYLSTLHYLVKASLILCCLFLPYYLYFSKSVSFIANRFYLLSTIVLTLSIPLMSFDVFPVFVTVITTLDNASSTTQGSTFYWTEFFDFVLSGLYLIGLIWMIIRLMYKFYVIKEIIGKSQSINQKNCTFIVAPSWPISSFFHYIFISSLSIEKMMIEHEQIHVNQKHSIDIILAEILKCILWFHPIAYSLRRAISLNHEFECDAKMTANYTYEQYANLLYDHIQTKNRNIFINQFYSFTKKRIAMMLHQKNNPKHQYHYVLMVPVLLVVFTFFSFRSYYIPTKRPNISTNSGTDTMPILMDTFITLDPETYVETIRVTKRKKDREPLEEMKIIQMNPEVITFSDTIVILDPNTYEEKVQIVKNKMVKGYKILIDYEYSKPNPDFKLIDKWTKEGARQ